MKKSLKSLKLEQDKLSSEIKELEASQKTLKKSFDATLQKYEQVNNASDGGSTNLTTQMLDTYYGELDSMSRLYSDVSSKIMDAKIRLRAIETDISIEESKLSYTQMQQQ